MYDVGVVVGRFQTNELTEGHRSLLDRVFAQHDKVVVVLGLSPLMVTSRNPLDFESRKQMLTREYPELTVLYVKDVHDDHLWSTNLDTLIKDVVSPTQTVLLYGSRDSFIPFYHGKHPVEELEPTVFVSATEVRNRLRRKAVPTADWRAGVCWAASNRFPTVYPTVDVAILNEDETKILLGKKKNESRLRFIGGFTDPKDTSYEAACRREAKEEAGIEITDPEYVGSRQVDDWRYRNEVDCITTLLFKAKVMFGRPNPGDDIYELHWVDVDPKSLNPDVLVPEHGHLLQMLCRNMQWDTFHEKWFKN